MNRQVFCPQIIYNLILFQARCHQTVFGFLCHWGDWKMNFAFSCNILFGCLAVQWLGCADSIVWVFILLLFGDFKGCVTMRLLVCREADVCLCDWAERCWWSLLSAFNHTQSGFRRGVGVLICAPKTRKWQGSDCKMYFSDFLLLCST